MNKYINETVLKLIANQNLCKLLKFNSNNPYAEIDIMDTGELIYSKIFPYSHVPETDKEVGSYLCIILDRFRLTSNQAIKSGQLNIDIIVHNDLWRMNGTGEMRPYAIMHEVDEALNGKIRVGIKDLTFSDCRHVRYNQSYSGFQLTYSIQSVN